MRWGNSSRSSSNRSLTASSQISGPWGRWALGTLGIGDPGPWGTVGLGDPGPLGPWAFGTLGSRDLGIISSWDTWHGSLRPSDLETLRPSDLVTLGPGDLRPSGLWDLGTLGPWETSNHVVTLGPFDLWILEPWDLGTLGPWPRTLGTSGQQFAKELGNDFFFGKPNPRHVITVSD